MKKRLIALILAIGMATGMLSMTASADAPDTVTQITSAGGVLSTSGTYVLTGDITFTGRYNLIIYEADVVIDLNGYTITGTDSPWGGYNHVLEVWSGSLTVIDSSAEGTGRVDAVNGGAAVYIESGGTFILNSGTLEGSIWNSGGEVIINGGTLEGKITNYGGEVIINGGTVNGVSYDTDTDTAAESAFTDVSADAYYYDAVDWAVGKGITTGTGDGTTFSPDDSCTRGQVVTFLYRAAGEPEVSGADNPFGDVSSGDYYYDAVLWAVENGITTGTSGTTFSPDETCTRGQVVTFLYRYAGTEAADTANPFADVDSSDYFYTPVLWAVENGITTGTTGTTFSPDETCTRGQVVTFLYRALAE